jgi:hypothetical protein
MDKAGWHTSGDLVVPENLSLVFLPPYSPELNPIERLWLQSPRQSLLALRFPDHWRDRRQLLRCSAKPVAFDPCVPIPGSNRSAINQVGISFREAGAGGSNPLTPTINFNKLSGNLLKQISVRRPTNALT